MGAIPVPGLAEQEGFIWTRQQPIGAPAARLPANRYGWGSTQLATTRTASAAASSAAMPQDAAPVIALDRPSWVLAAQLEQSLQSSRAAAQQPRTAQQDTQHVQHEPEQQSVAEHAAAEAPTAQRSAVSEDLVERVLVARQRFVRHQKQLDEGLVRAGLRAPNHIKVAEECADMLLDELLQESACEVDQICDDFCDQLFASEFLEP
ncbi:hypothetical protein WJX72_003593 [[Myrmecia] bisecta]|uniref:Uncharacterized protein n=1 Tax=[Myrmecia] bisecta TaxID=41462 RepID=A0AAW1Q8J7_9CHLO